MPNVSKGLFPDFSLHIVCKLVNLKIIAEKSVYFLMIEPKNTLKNLKTYDVPAYPEKWAMKLDSNENYIGPSPKVLNAIKNITIGEISHYPYYGGLYDALCKKYDVSKSSIVITNGADEAIFALINTYMTQQSSMLTVTPAFSMPKIYAAQIGCEYVEVPYEKRWEFPFESFVKSVKQNTKIIWLTSPNNPTGTVIAPEQIKYILEHFKDRLVVVDETYGAFSDYSCIQLVKTYKNLAVVKSMSKDYALAGLRLGFVVSDSKNILNIKKMLSPYNVNAVAAKAAIAAVSDDQHFQKMKAELNKSKKFLTEEFKKLKVKVYDSHANFILAEFGEKTDYVYNVLLKNRIIVKKYDELGALRITLPAFEAAKNLAGLITTRDVIVFDMDGVLVDVQNSYRLAIAETYKYFTKREISQEDIKAAKNLGGLNNDWDLTYHLLKSAGTWVPYDDIVEKFQQMYWNDGKGCINDESLIIDKTLLETLSQRYILAVFTGRPRVEAEFTLKKFDILKYFSKIVTMNDVPKERQKPDTLGLEKIRTSVFAGKMLYVGDTVDDVKCAKEFRITGFGVAHTREQADLLLNNGAKFVLNSVNQLGDFIK